MASPAPSDPASVPSPCVGICRLDKDSRRCTGCGRTLDEIGRWSTMSDTDKLAVWARLDRDGQRLHRPA